MLFIKVINARVRLISRTLPSAKSRRYTFPSRYHPCFTPVLRSDLTFKDIEVLLFARTSAVLTFNGYVQRLKRLPKIMNPVIFQDYVNLSGVKIMIVANYLQFFHGVKNIDKEHF